MCGIVGVLALGHGYTVSPELLVDMREELAHRGPDGLGLWVDDVARIGLGFRRLAIVDLSSAADQPMSNEDGTLRVVFNGEIYNHAEIRAELEELGGHAWSTDHSDTEVILHAFEQWGIDCLARFRGMFAIAIWDARERALWLIRDRIGIKPLYYSLDAEHVAFASEIKALLADPQQERALDEESLFHYLSFISTPAPRTLFRGIRKLGAGSWIRVSHDGSIREQQWWDVLDHTDPMIDVPESEVAGRVLDELRTAVRYRKVSDVPVGIFLSGGIDSSTNAALFSEGSDRDVRTFSIGYEGEHASNPDELPWARLVAEAVGSRHTELRLDQDDVIDFLPQMARLQDEPIADPVCVPVYYVSRLARDHGVIAAQVGEGADELFCGYPWWLRSLRVQRLNDAPFPSALKRLALRGLHARGQSSSLRYELLRRGSLGLPVFWGSVEAFGQAQKERLLSPRLRSELAGMTSWDVIAPLHERFLDKAWEPSPLNWMTYVDLKVRLPELLLMRVDKMSMGASLEGRVPFLDHHLVALAMSIPSATKVRNGSLKHILKLAVRGVIPDEIIDRPKQGFGVPVFEWYQDRLGATIQADITAFCRETDVLDEREVGRVLAEGDASKAWFLHNLATWWREYLR